MLRSSLNSAATLRGGRRQRPNQSLPGLPTLAASVTAIAALFASSLLADGPADNHPESVRRVPKLGIELSQQQRQEIQQGLATLERAIAPLKNRKDPRTQELLPDVQIFHKAVHDALTHQEFFSPGDVKAAVELLAEGRLRAEQLANGDAPWTNARGLVVRGYLSKIDGSVQPYGLVVPESYSHETAGRYRVDLWFHGRGETLSEVSFLNQRRRQVGQFAPQDTIVLHPYGRYSNAFKFAGEVDVLEALDSVRRRYRVDDNRIAARGFSMGGAACWQFAVHYSDRWFAANPGAGFAETQEFLKFFQGETPEPTWYERKLWHWYDCPDWAANLHQCPTVAYSGELDRQKQAADIMQEALAREEIDLVHIIGPETKHAYHPQAREHVAQRLDALARNGRQRIPRTVHFVTYTLKYNHMNWVTIDGLGQHWERASVDGRIAGDAAVDVETSNVTDFTLAMAPGDCPFEITEPVTLHVDGETLPGPRPKSDRSWHVSLHRTSEGWQVGRREVEGLAKRHNLQGPIDDALMDSFIFVRPTGKSPNEAVAKWAESELDHAIEHWRRHFRGDARVKDDVAVTDADIASANLILWGDAESNAVLKRIADKLPIRWDAKRIVADDRTWPADHHALIAVYPNPLNPERYVVLNSSFTYREYAYLNNARQVPKLPDWAVIDVRTPPDTLWPGKVVDADFFDERWRLKVRGER
ncbi:MAG: prolyl oligopeptidase family serine peptidase [Pirellulaceae bacterium]